MAVYININGAQTEGKSFWDLEAETKDLVGKVPISISESSTRIIFTFEDGWVAEFFHQQDCCESVWLEDVNGDWEDLIGVPLLVVDERAEDNKDASEHGTYTFYTFRSLKGSVDVRWCGESNGYYSESVDLILFKEIKEDD